MSDAVENIEEVEEATGEVTENVETNGDLSNGVGSFDEIETAEEATEGDTADVETVEEAEEQEETPAKLTFEERAEDMGLTIMAPGCYHYSDAYSEVLYRTLQQALMVLWKNVRFRRLHCLQNLQVLMGNGVILVSFLRSINLKEMIPFSRKFGLVLHQLVMLY